MCADSSCDTVGATNKRLRRYGNTVHLDDTRCDGSAHGGCQAQCTLFWKEAWLRRASQIGGRTAGGIPRPRFTEAQLNDAVYRDRSAGEPLYCCQATDHAIASEPIDTYSPMQYVRDVRSGNLPFGAMTKLLVWWILKRSRGFSGVQGAGVAVQHAELTCAAACSSPLSPANTRKTPREKLDLVPGELVQIKTVDEIKATLDANKKNRGLYFDVEMVPFWVRTCRVRERVNQIIEEPTGKMMKIPGDCIVLEGTACTGKYHMSCPRAIFPYWREIWLSRVDENGQELAKQSTTLAST
jgi:hypothetical protein